MVLSRNNTYFAGSGDEAVLADNPNAPSEGKKSIQDFGGEIYFIFVIRIWLFTLEGDREAWPWGLISQPCPGFGGLLLSKHMEIIRENEH